MGKISFLIRCIFICIFLYSAIWKIINWEKYKSVVLSYGIVGEGRLLLTSLVVVVSEIGLVLLLIKSDFWKISSGFGSLLITVFTIILLTKYGEVLVNGCGCIGDDELHQIGFRDILKNIIMLMGFVLIVMIEKTRGQT
ncbi:MauE/DoxX family redox-associated membrane protein [Aneurinibacillus aneurinilyticus]|uniref:Methylamine utilisation protein MauE domain-containing protein n=1 Tax=Aneurinibacillus aneurinilyticus ATCC 12856 TaxID=649747 RepID=U1WNN1_ANEAE|nr:MauE/DoxX family redox-associated membrane protein [Aneurinibacillus aneurinilyticus]ERI10209.1 hypothetical protein HMPREF0083_01701 [Aneurinibacillus aneurinilyticus ATCC 12856]MED0709809.1 hypothetical protein [Aneurinibacillus aneurinilyticus]MED0726503.1 hypothetical protein [Aneurinibacillus aneurinilyticus]MED0735154.1 hypothetical protein [Aneurinibacillus aneurinilyticus]MED0743495.1 hypothetical protein [Aneurinibacillus aneurinilyticus]